MAMAAALTGAANAAMAYDWAIPGWLPPPPVPADVTMSDALIIGFRTTDTEIADLIAFLNSLSDEAFLANPAHANPWPEGHSAKDGAVAPPDTDPS